MHSFEHSKIKNPLFFTTGKAKDGKIPAVNYMGKLNTPNNPSTPSSASSKPDQQKTAPKKFNPTVIGSPPPLPGMDYNKVPLQKQNIPNAADLHKNDWQPELDADKLNKFLNMGNS